MSQYIHFFIRNNDKFLPIATYSRSTEFYNQFNEFAPYGRISAINRSTLVKVRDSVESAICDSEKSISDIKETIASIQGFNNSVEDKLEALYQNKTYLDEAEECLESLNEVNSFINFLDIILDEADSYQYDCEESDNFNKEKYLYFGVECSYPTVNDIM